MTTIFILAWWCRTLALACLSLTLLAALVINASTAPLSTATPSKAGEYFAICAAINERPETMKEWVDYHAALGIQKFYLMLTDYPESEAMVAALKSHIDVGRVELYCLPRVNPQTINMLQVRLYEACLESVRDKHQFVGFWDADEFLIPLDPTIKFPEFLQSFENHGALAVSWRVVGPSGHITRPSSSSSSSLKESNVLSSYLSCTPWDFIDNGEIKSIVNTRYALHPTTDPHSFIYKEGFFAVDAEKRRVDGTRNPYIASDWKDKGVAPRVALYHYVTKSEEEYLEKMRRGSAMGNRKDESYFWRISKAAGVVCTEAKEVCVRLGLCLENSLQSREKTTVR